MYTIKKRVLSKSMYRLVFPRLKRLSIHRHYSQTDRQIEMKLVLASPVYTTCDDVVYTSLSNEQTKLQFYLHGCKV